MPPWEPELVKAAARLLAIALVTAALGVAALYTWGVRMSDLAHFGEVRNALYVNGETVKIPLPEGNPRRLAPIVVAGETGEFGFTLVGIDGPVLHDPCVAIGWQISTPSMPPGADDVVREAVAEIAARTGLVWEDKGYTGQPATFDRPSLVFTAEWEWAPVVIGWGTEGDNLDLEGATAGVGGPMETPGAYGETHYLRSGTVVLDVDAFPTNLDDEGQRAQARAVIMHELGHVVGLDHVTDANELMYPASTAVTTWGPGDLRGLAAAGAGACEVA